MGIHTDALNASSRSISATALCDMKRRAERWHLQFDDAVKDAEKLCMGSNEVRRLIACSQRRHGQDKTVLSCLVRVGSVDTIGDKTSVFSCRQL